jgi:SAM-dependent methyltransferase
MAATAAKAERVPKDWWRTFFGPLAGIVMFEPKAAQSRAEAELVLRRARVRPGARILDLACGVGRHSLAFAALGHEVVGLDYSKPYLAAARAAARKAGLAGRLRFVEGDMRRATRHVGRGGFDLAVSLYNSFGYFDRRADDRQVLDEAFRALEPGGAFVLNTLHAGGVRVVLAAPRQLGREPLPDVFMLDHARYDARRRRTLCTWTIIDARKSRARIVRHSFGQNVYSHADMKAMLRAAGFRVERVWGLLGGARFSPRAWHQTLVARKPGRAPRKPGELRGIRRRRPSRCAPAESAA